MAGATEADKKPEEEGFPEEEESSEEEGLEDEWEDCEPLVMKISIPSGLDPKLWEKSDVRSPQWAKFLAKPAEALKAAPPSQVSQEATRAALVPCGLVDDVVVATCDQFEATEEEVEAAWKSRDADFFVRDAILLERLPPPGSSQEKHQGRMEGRMEGRMSALDPKVEKKSRPAAPDKIEWFCFPNGSVELKYRVKRPRPSSHVFALFADGSPLRGIVLTFYVEAENSSNSSQNKRRLWVPMAICLLTRLAIVPALEAWLEQLARLIYAEKQLKKETRDRLLAATVQLADEVPRPMAGVFAVKMAGPLREVIHVREHFAASRGNQLRRASDVFFSKFLARATGGAGSMWLTASLLGPAALCTALACVLLERPLLFIAESTAILTPVAEALLALVRPFEWSHVYVPILPKPLLELLDAPQPYVLGVLSEWLPEEPCVDDSSTLLGCGEDTSISETTTVVARGDLSRDTSFHRDVSVHQAHSNELERAASKLSSVGDPSSPRAPPRRFGSNVSALTHEDSKSSVLSADDGLPRVLREYNRNNSSQTKLRRRLRGGLNDKRSASNTSLIGGGDNSGRPTSMQSVESLSDSMMKKLRFFPTARRTLRRNDSSKTGSFFSHNNHNHQHQKHQSPFTVKSRSSFWTTTAVSPGCVAFDLETGSFFLPPFTGDEAIPELPADFAAAVAEATRKLVAAADDALVVKDWPVSPTNKNDIPKAERYLQRVCATHLEAIIRGGGRTTKDKKKPTTSEAASSSPSRPEPEKNEEEEQPRQGFMLDAEQFVALHPVEAQKPFVAQLVETQHFWQFVDSTLPSDAGRSVNPEGDDIDKIFDDETPRECLARRGFRFLDGLKDAQDLGKKKKNQKTSSASSSFYANSPRTPGRNTHFDPQDPLDAHCYTVPPPLPQDAADETTKVASQQVVARYVDDEASKYSWHPKPIFAAKHACTNATRVYRYGTLADLLGLRFDDLWTQLEGDSTDAARGTS